MIVNHSNLRDVFTGFSGAYQNGFESAESAYAKIAMTVPSSSASENYGWLGQMPKMKEWVGDRIVGNLMVHTYAVENKKFESTVEVDRTAIEDDKYGVYAPFFKEMGRSAAEHPDELIFSLLVKGFTTKCYDGQYFFDTDHPVKVGDNTVSVANTDGGAGTPWFLLDTSRAVKPMLYQERIPYKLTALDADNDRDVFFRDKFTYGVRARSNAGFGLWQLAWGSKQTLDVTAYELARKSLMEMKGDEGRPLGVKPGVLVVPPSLEGEARALVGAQIDAGGGTNKWYGMADIVVSPWLA